ncbi:SET domain-containing protein 4 [Aricia agestis]|uniref:SET domain-containing protein 4 n=1 Tax=Aricia agestis TaxID=91739 RepID=UPI001C206D31|nr:SET domain-containing protein 4 [Aricia agestis]
MGRTQRKRKLKQANKFYTCNNEQDLIALNSWLSKHDVRYSKKLVMAVFDDTGRGVLTKKKIKAGEELMSLPLNLTINVSSLLTDSAFCDIFTSNTSVCLQDYKNSVTFQCLLAFYILYLKSQGLSSKWHIYLESLPKEYTVPYFLPSDIQSHLHKEILSVIENQRNIIDKSFNIFKDILCSCISDIPTVKSFKEYLSMSKYEWAYFTVNTRCVFMDLSNILDFRNLSDTILSLITDNTKISLCPYLDMINHDRNAKNETRLKINKDLSFTPVSKLEEDTFSSVRFSIYTKNNFEPFSQVFICYGDSHNSKLITEYGFFLPHNELDSIIFDFDKIVYYFKETGVCLSSDQTAFIINHGLNKDLYIDSKGLSFNFYGLLMAAKYYYKEDVNISKLIYTAAVQADDSVLTDFIKPLVRCELDDLRIRINNLNSCRQCVILDNCISLLCQYVRILEKFILC